MREICIGKCFSDILRRNIDDSTFGGEKASRPVEICRRDTFGFQYYGLLKGITVSF